MQDGRVLFFFKKKMFWKWMKMGKQRAQILNRMKNKSHEIIWSEI